MREIWKDIKGFEGYYRISNLGNVMSTGAKRKTNGSGNYDRKIAQKLMNVNEAICLRNNIEKPLGFHNSQALIGMQRTPNNTLPIFWDNKKAAETSDFSD